MNQWQSRITVGLFYVLLFGLALATMIKPSADFSETENRVLTQRPEATLGTILDGEFETRYEEYLTDQFILRDRWIGLKTSVERLCLKRESKDIYFADDGYLIEKHSGIFASDTARRNLSIIAQFAERYQERPERLTVMIVPNAVDILEDKLPPFASLGGGAEYLTQIADVLPQEVWFDTVPILQLHKEEELYYRTDHHWKTLAAFYAYRGWAEAQGYSIPVLTDYDIQTVTEDFEGTIQSKLGIKTAGDTIELFLPKHETSCTLQKGNSEDVATSLYDASALDTKDKYAVYFGGNQAFMSIRTDADSERKILAIKDSYANCFIPFMLGEFQQIDVLDLRYDRQSVSSRIAAGGYTDVLILYNAAGFAEDTSIPNLIR